VNPPPFSEFTRWLCEGRVKTVTAESYVKRVRLLSKLANIDDSNKARAVICAYPVSEARKQLLANAYSYYCEFKGYAWDKPKFTREQMPIFLPLESELDALIANTREKMSVFLQFLKETGADSGEAWKLRWIDIDPERKTVAITPTKNHNSRTLSISANLLSRLLKLSRKNERVFASKNLDKMRWLYERARNLLAVKLENPRIHEIAFKSFRHWKATMVYHQTKDILYVKWFLGHKRLENTLVYTHLVSLESDEYHSAVADTIDKARKLIESRFEYATEIDNIRLFRKRK
jgi:integrase